MTPGEHLIVLGQEADAYRARDLGLHLRDTLVILTPGFRTLCAFLFRAPLDGTVTDNVLRHGCGGLQIDRCRVFTDWQESDRPPSWKRSGHTAKPDADKIAAPPGQGIVCHPGGRWPSNLVLVHGPGCARVGTKQVQAHAAFGKPGDSKGGILNKTGEARKNPHPGFADSEGKETVPAWECQPDCPVGMLDQQSAARGMHRAGNKAPPKSNVDHGFWIDGGWKPMGRNPDMYSDEGGASRFYPQFPDLPAALDWLTRLALLPGVACDLLPTAATVGLD